MNKRLVAVSLVGLGLLALTACTSEDTIQLSSNDSQLRGISVSGSGDANGVPDLALLSLGVSSREDSVKEARDNAAEAMNKVLSSLKENGVEEKDVQTEQFSIYPEFDYDDDGRQILRGFRVTNIVSAKIRDLDKVGEIIDDTVEAGGDLTEVQGLSFTIEDPDDLRAQAREEAVAEARAKAEKLAELSGVKLGKPLSISEDSFFPPPPIPLGADFAREEAAAPETPIETGEMTVTTTVSIVFAIE